MKKTILLFMSLLSASLFVHAEENYSYREVAEKAVSSEYGTHDQSAAIMFAGAQMGFVGAGSFVITGNVELLKFWTEATDNAQRVFLTTDANGYYNLNVNSGKFNVTSTEKLTRGFHRFTMFVRRGVKGGNTQLIKVIVHVDGNEIFNVGDDSKSFDQGPFRIVTFGGTNGNLVSGAMWTSAAGCGTQAEDGDIIAKLDQDANNKYQYFSNSLKLVWSEEFEGESVDKKKWNRVPIVANPAGWRKNTSMREELVTVEDGALVLKGIKNDGKDPNETSEYLCGQVWTSGKFSFTKGVFEFKAKFENQSGAWPSIWLLPDLGNWPLGGEIDVLEHLNSDAFVHQTVHHGPIVNGSSTSDSAHDNLINVEDWNVYRLEWSDEEINWFVNGEKTYTYRNEHTGKDQWPFDTPFYIILSQQLAGSSWVGDVKDESTLPVNMYIDYVRVYQDEIIETQNRRVNLVGTLNFDDIDIVKDEQATFMVKAKPTLRFNRTGRIDFDHKLEGSGTLTIDAPGARVFVPNARDFAGTILATEGTELVIPTDLAGNNSNLAFSALQTQSSYYRGKDEFQPLIGLKAEKLQFNTFWRLSVELPDDVDPAMIADFKLYKSSVPYFAFSQATELWDGLTKTRDGRKFKLSFQNSGNYPTINPQDYLWVCVRIGAEAPANAKLDAKLTEVVVNGYYANVKNSNPYGYGTIYPWAFHIVPYWRLNGWTMNALTADHFAAYTDIIAFYITIDANGNVGHGWNGEQFTDAKFAAAIEKMKKLRGDRDVRILAGVGFSQGNLPGVTADPVKRKRAAEGLAAFVEKFGLDGIDFDWEYPTAKAHWEGWRDLVTELKPLLFALPGGGKQVSIAVTGWRTQQGGSTLGAGEAVAGLYQQCDFVSMMSYDDDNAAGHSTLALMQNDFARAATYGHLPAYKINGGQAFYTNHYPCDGSQNGYSWVVNNYPEYIDSTDRFTASDGKVYTYNSIATIKAKCADALTCGGGVMIWANETDVSLTHEKSATRAMHSIIRPTRSVPNELNPSADWARFTTTTSADPTWFVGEDGITYFSVGGGATMVTINFVAELPSGKSGTLVGWTIENNVVRLDYDSAANRFDVTYNGGSSHPATVKLVPLDVAKPHIYTISISAAEEGTRVYQDGYEIVSAPNVKWANKRLGMAFAFGGGLGDVRGFSNLKIYAADLNYTTASNTQDRILPTSVKVNGLALSLEEKRSVAKIFGPLVEEVNLAVASFDPETGTIEVSLDTPLMNGSVCVYATSELSGEWTRIAAINQPTESVIKLDKERLFGYKFFKVMVEELSRQN